MAQRRALILTHPARLGDSILSIPLHRALAAHYELHTNLGDPYRFLLRDIPEPIQFLPPLAPKSVVELVREARQLSDRDFSTAFILRPSFRSALLVRLAKIPQRVGEATEGRGWLLTHKLPYSPDMPELDRMDAIARLVGLETNKEATLEPRPEEIAKAKEALGDADVGIVPGGTWPEKLIPTETLRQTISYLQSIGRHPVILGGPGDEIYADPLRSTGAKNLVAKFKLPEMAGVLKSLDLLITPDGGLSHYAVACGTPALIAFGPTPANRWGHFVEPHRTIIAPEGRMDRLTFAELRPHVEAMLANK